jgi:hypothetical protein
MTKECTIPDVGSLEDPTPFTNEELCELHGIP